LTCLLPKLSISTALAERVSAIGIGTTPAVSRMLSYLNPCSCSQVLASHMRTVPSLLHDNTWLPSLLYSTSCTQQQNKNTHSMQDNITKNRFCVIIGGLS
jgi:hypothetical protein